MSKPLNLEGILFERLLVKERVLEKKSGGHIRWRCECSCGSNKVIILSSSDLVRGNSRSCGCLQKEGAAARVRTHDLSKSSEYNIWFGIKARCFNKKSKAFSNYGARGITMDLEWKDSFEAFYQDMGPRPSPDHSIERRENDKGYYKENCKWGTWEEQANNNRRVILYDFDGEKLSISQIARKIGLSVSALHQRLKRMSLEEATKHRSITFDGMTKPLVDWCLLFDLNLQDTYRRLLKGEEFGNIVSP